jgi:arsenate reductase
MAIHQLKVYHYPACSTCKNALKYLDARRAQYEAIHIVDQPPSLAELRKALAELKENGGKLKQLFNTSGLVYKELNLTTKLPLMSEAEALQLLAKNGKLIKRPFVVNPNFHLIGFKQAEWDQKIS